MRYRLWTHCHIPHCCISALLHCLPEITYGRRLENLSRHHCFRFAYWPECLAESVYSRSIVNVPWVSSCSTWLAGIAWEREAENTDATTEADGMASLEAAQEQRRFGPNLSLMEVSIPCALATHCSGFPKSAVCIYQPCIEKLSKPLSVVVDCQTLGPHRCLQSDQL